MEAFSCLRPVWIVRGGSGDGTVVPIPPLGAALRVVCDASRICGISPLEIGQPEAIFNAGKCILCEG